MANNEIDKFGKIENNDLIPIAAKHRHGDPKDLFTMWIGSNTNYVVMITGTLLISLGLGFWNAVLILLIGNILGGIILGVMSLTGPRTGSSGIVTSRTSFGQLGAFVPIVINTIMVFGWFLVNTVIATLGLAQIFVKLGMLDNYTIKYISLVIVVGGEIILALYGHATILKFEKWLSYILGAAFLIFFVFLIPKMNWSFTAEVVKNSSTTSLGIWLLGLAAIIAYGVSWANFASDYSRYLPANSNKKRIVLFAGLGQFLSLTLVEFIGVMFGIIAKCSLGGISDNPVSQVQSLVPGWFFYIFMLVVVIGCMATNVPNGYTAQLSILALRIPITRIKSTIVICIAVLIMGVVSINFGQFYSLFQNFLSYDAFWTCPWMGIIIVDFILRKGNYSSEDLMKWGEDGKYWYRNGILWSGIIAFVVGIASSFLFMNSGLYAGPISTQFLGGGDLSDFIGFIVGSVVFYLLARNSNIYETSQNIDEDELLSENC